MNPLTHFLAGWTAAEGARLEPRDRAIVTWAGVVADLDALTIVPDLFNRYVRGVQTLYYLDYHHVLTHGLPAALLMAGVAFVIARRRWKTSLLALLSFHLHLLCDLVGSRGPAPTDLWPIGYLQPVSSKLTLLWSGQWALNAWPNIALSVLLLGVALVLAVRRGYSPLGIFSGRADRAFVAALRARFGVREQVPAGGSPPAPRHRMQETPSEGDNPRPNWDAGVECPPSGSQGRTVSVPHSDVQQGAACVGPFAWSSSSRPTTTTTAM